MTVFHAARSLAFGLALLGAGGCEQSDEAAKAAGQPVSGDATAGREAAKAGAKIDDANYVVELEAVGPYKTGEKATARVVLLPKGVYKINEEYPMKLKLAGPQGLVFDKATLAKSDFNYSPKKGVFEVAFTPADAGETKIAGTLSMSVCSEENCLIEKVSLEKSITVE